MLQAVSAFLKQSTVVFFLGLLLYGTIGKSQSPSLFTENMLVLPGSPHTISFYWQGDSVNDKWEPHTALLLPVKLKNCPKQFYMQFDLGHPYSVFYKDKLEAIRLQYPKAIPPAGAENKLVNFSFHAGKMSVQAKEIALQQFDSVSNINWKDKKSVEIIGTIGTDLIDGKTVIINYPKQQLTLSSSIPATLLKQVSLADFVYTARSVLLPSTIQGKETLLYFDTGSSMYELLTNKKNCETLALPGSSFTESRVRSWNKYVTAYTIASGTSITIGDASIPVHYATYIEGASNARAEQMMQMGIGGMTGNKLFLDYTLVLDTKNKKFGLIASK